MKSILFVDFTSPTPYDGMSLKTQGLGGTEATVIRIVERLKYLGVLVKCEQMRRQDQKEGPESLDYLPLGATEATDFKTVVSLRTPHALKYAFERYPKAKHYFWVHDLPTRNDILMLPILRKTNATVLAVSKWHRSQMIETYKSGGYEGEFKVDYVYNPIEDDLTATTTDFDPHRFCFISNPAKNLEYVLQIFKAYKAHDPHATLDIAWPSYATAPKPDVSGVNLIGNLTPTKAQELLRGACAHLSLNYSYPETFGLVLAEANAVGTPVLTHEVGAVREVLNPHNSQLINCRDQTLVIKTMMKWADRDRPVVKAKDEFRISNVIKKWMALLND